MPSSQHVRDGTITLKTEKTSQVVTLLVLPELAASIAACPFGELAYITGLGGR